MARFYIITEGVVCDGYDVTCVADGRRMTFHFLARPADTLVAVTSLAEARLAAEDDEPFEIITEDGTNA